MQGYDIHISLDEQQLVFVGILGKIQGENAVALFIYRSVGGVDILGLRVIHDSAAEGYHVAPKVDYREHHAVAEIIVIIRLAVLIRAPDEVSEHHFLIGEALGAKVLRQGVPAVGRIAEAEVPDRGGSERTAQKIVERRAVFLIHKAGVEKSRCLSVRRKRTHSPLGKRIVVAVLGHGHPRHLSDGLDRLNIVEVVYPADEADDVAARAAAEAIE